MTKIGKFYRWEMGHRLIDHPGGCRNLHGHSYRLEVDVEGEPGPDGMVIDYDEISGAIKPLLAEWDHAFMCHDLDADLLQFLRSHHLKHVVVPFPSTVENICRLVGDRIGPMLAARPNVHVFTVRVRETESSYAELTTRVPEAT